MPSTIRSTRPRGPPVSASRTGIAPSVLTIQAEKFRGSSFLHAGPSGTTVAAITRAQDVSTQAVQGQVRGLVGRGHLEIGPDPVDARARRAVHTARGRGLERTLAATKRSLHAGVEHALGFGGMERLRRALGTAGDAVGE